MKKLLSLAGLVLLVVVGLGQSAFQRTMLTTNTVPAGVNGQVLVLLSGVPRWSTNAGSLTLSNVTILGTLTVGTQLVINGTGPGTIQLYATNGTSIVTISSADSFSSYTLYLPTAIQTNSVLQSTADGHLYWSTDPVLNSVEVTGSGAGYLLIGDASTTNTFKLVGPAAFGSSFTNLWPVNPGTNGQVLTMGTNGQWYFGTPGSSGGDTLWTNDAGLYPVGQTLNLSLGYGALGNTTNANFNVALGPSALGLAAFGANNAVVGFQAGAATTDGADNVGVGYQSLLANTTGSENTAVGSHALQLVEDGVGNTALGYNAGVASPSLTNTIAIGDGVVTTNSSDAVFGNDQHAYWFPGTNGMTLGGVRVLTRVEPLTALTWGATTTISVAASETNYRTLALGGDTVVATSNRAAGHWFTCIITGAATNCAVSWPSWVPMNQALPATITAGKHVSVTVFFTDTSDANAIANLAAEP